MDEASVANVVLGQFEKVQRSKSKWKVGAPGAAARGTCLGGQCWLAWGRSAAPHLRAVVHEMSCMGMLPHYPAPRRCAGPAGGAQGLRAHAERARLPGSQVHGGDGLLDKLQPGHSSTRPGAACCQPSATSVAAPPPSNPGPPIKTHVLLSLRAHPRFACFPAVPFPCSPLLLSVFQWKLH